MPIELRGTLLSSILFMEEAIENVECTLFGGRLTIGSCWATINLVVFPTNHIRKKRVS